MSELVNDNASGQDRRDTGGPLPRGRGGVEEGRGFFSGYKSEQGIWTRRSTFIGLAALIAWGAVFVDECLRVYQDVDAWWSLLITPGIAFAVAVMLGAFAYWASFVHRKSSDFMIATEGEMKKVNWSSKREVIGSTKVVIVITALLAVLLFFVDLCFQTLFRELGVLKVG